jgi:hypothetical protein
MPILKVDPPKRSKFGGSKRNMPSTRSNTDAVTERNRLSPAQQQRRREKYIPKTDRYGRPVQRWGI